MNKFFAACIFTILLFLSMPALASNACFNGTSGLANGAQANIDAHGTCAKVTNNTGHNLCVPSATSAMWSSFRTSPPTGATLGSCGGTWTLYFTVGVAGYLMFDTMDGNCGYITSQGSNVPNNPACGTFDTPDGMPCSTIGARCNFEFGGCNSWCCGEVNIIYAYECQ